MAASIGSTFRAFFYVIVILASATGFGCSIWFYVDRRAHSGYLKWCNDLLAAASAITSIWVLLLLIHNNRVHATNSLATVRAHFSANCFFAIIWTVVSIVLSVRAVDECDPASTGTKRVQWCRVAEAEAAVGWLIVLITTVTAVLVRRKGKRIGYSENMGVEEKTSVTAA